MDPISSMLNKDQGGKKTKKKTGVGWMRYFVLCLYRGLLLFVLTHKHLLILLIFLVYVHDK